MIHTVAHSILRMSHAENERSSMPRYVGWPTRLRAVLRIMLMTIISMMRNQPLIVRHPQKPHHCSIQQAAIMRDAKSVLNVGRSQRLQSDFSSQRNRNLILQGNRAETPRFWRNPYSKSQNHPRISMPSEFFAADGSLFLACFSIR